jgi:hypothetical protein
MIRALVFIPGRTPAVRYLPDGLDAYRQALQVQELEFTPVVWEGRRYQFVADDGAVASNLPPNREMLGGKFDGWVIRGPFLVTGIDGDRSASLDDRDLRILMSHLKTPRCGQERRP